MINIAGLNKNDEVNGKGISISLFLQGCHFHCKGCHNPETWNPEGGESWDEEELIDEIISAIAANGIQRNFSILGGEPLDTEQKINFINDLILEVRTIYPNIKICIWTGYNYENIKNNEEIQYIFNNIDYLIEGPFILAERDITLKWRGSRNQNIINIKTGQIENEDN